MFCPHAVVVRFTHCKTCSRLITRANHIIIIQECFESLKPTDFKETRWMMKALLVEPFSELAPFWPINNKSSCGKEKTDDGMSSAPTAGYQGGG